MIFPEWTNFNIIFYSILFVIMLSTAPSIYFGEQNNKTPVRYAIPSRLHMLIVYSAPLLALFFSAKDYVSNANFIQWIVLASIGIHFSKRILESVFVHKYSGSTSIFATLSIAFFYSFASFLIGYLNHKPIAHIDFGFMLGFIFYVIGNIGNFIHHKILANLRKDSLAYIIPHGGLFDYVVCPHYLFEIFTWVGIFLFSRHLGSFLMVGMMASFLSARSLNALKWYQEKFSDFPKDKKAMIPFVM